LLLPLGLAQPAGAQQLGALETYGADGRLYSLDKNEHYLLSRQPYQSEDSSGYMGQIRFVIKYEGGGYEIKTREYTARCRAVDDQSQVVTYEPGREEDTSSTAAIHPAKTPSADMKNAYNLFWAACYGKFRKFK
jgi:hypothetical protein